MLEKRAYFFNTVESKLSSVDIFLSKPNKLLDYLQDLESFLKNNWPPIFSSLNDEPLNSKEKELLNTLLNRIDNLYKKVGYKISFFNDFQNYMKVSIEK